jgi:hypothetical protein
MMIKPLLQRRFPLMTDDPQVQGIATVFDGSNNQFIDSTQGEPKNIYKP